VAANAIATDLTENGFVLRYHTDETDDGFSGNEGTTFSLINGGFGCPIARTP
jgi:GH15 family glucan-1,4-alpha-glucosidase